MLALCTYAASAYLGETTCLHYVLMLPPHTLGALALREQAQVEHYSSSVDSSNVYMRQAASWMHERTVFSDGYTWPIRSHVEKRASMQRERERERESCWQREIIGGG